MTTTSKTTRRAYRVTFKHNGETHEAFVGATNPVDAKLAIIYSVTYRNAEIISVN